MPLLSIEDLTIEFATDGGPVRVVDRLSLSMEAGETLCLVGESGSGKSVTALSVARLLAAPPVSYPTGKILLNGADVLKMDQRALRQIRGGIVGYVFQEPGASLNPVFRVGQQIKESLKIHRPEAATDAEVLRLLTLVGIPAPESRIRDYPHQMSGGMQQRIMIAMALAAQPKLLIADEPTTALDVTIQAQIMDLLRDLKNRLGMAILLITHNLGIVKDIADQVAVMYAGQLVEWGKAADVIQAPAHPYTRALIRSVPQLGDLHERLPAIGGHVPPAGTFPQGCRFHPRCPQVRTECGDELFQPALEATDGGGLARCPFWKTQGGPA